MPAQSRSWRYYHILHGRYTEQLTQFEVGNDLGLSVRQLRRQEKRALAVLADKIWMHYKPESAERELAGQDRKRSVTSWLGHNPLSPANWSRSTP